jgi:hypothetical protein
MVNFRHNSYLFLGACCYAAIALFLWMKHPAIDGKRTHGTVRACAVPTKEAWFVDCSKNHLNSPNGQYFIDFIRRSNVSYSNPAGVDLDGHVLSLLKKGQKKGILFYSFIRSVDTLWAPDSSSFVVNDWVGSNVAEPSLFRVEDPSIKVDILDKLTESLTTKQDKETMANALHSYVHATKWLSPSVLEIKAEGNGFGASNRPPCREFSLTYTWDLRSDKFTHVRSVFRLP